jgi:8-oxo-dGTP pyrophosphatase MutT (NUDIX family)
MYKVFIENKAIIFKKGSGNTPELYLQYGPCLKKSAFSDFSSALGQQKDALIIYSETPKKTFEQFFSKFLFIEAAGGIVQSIENPKQYLFIKRWGKWDIPKGKLEKGENPEEGAQREIHEECNVQALQKVADLPCTYHVYFMYEKHVLKKTYWYLFEANFDQELIPQAEEDITEVRWFKKDEINTVYANTYSSIQSLLDQLF